MTHLYTPQRDTHTGNTHQPKPQLKSSSCSSAIPSHNSRFVIPSHNSRNAMCLTLILSHNSRDTFRATIQGTPESWPSRLSPKPCRPRTSKASKAPLLHSIAWRSTRVASRTMLSDRLAGTRAARRQVPLVPLSSGVAWRDDPPRQAPHSLVAPAILALAWRSKLYRQALYQYFELYWFRPFRLDFGPPQLFHGPSNCYQSYQFQSMILNLPFLCLAITTPLMTISLSWSYNPFKSTKAKPDYSTLDQSHNQTWTYHCFHCYIKLKSLKLNMPNYNLP